MTGGLAFLTSIFGGIEVTGASAAGAIIFLVTLTGGFPIVFGASLEPPG